jgi:hypothetical protein
MGPPVKALESGPLSDQSGLGLMSRRKRPVANDPKRSIDVAQNQDFRTSTGSFQ